MESCWEIRHPCKRRSTATALCCSEHTQAVRKPSTTLSFQSYAAYHFSKCSTARRKLNFTYPLVLRFLRALSKSKVQC
jgi:hypothetical protein